ncbi:ABC transporter permease [Caldivirga maquilingensis]|uniref:Binding-protein-dependent transport systems inner membrane component n=1 Tax=Caldivirga maquilingensis (strain ATCC 700844 / DSM 13496 / JCM 10307 / IC-167) TaxID=397948 RepID=A8MCL7_CALMQ|nr:ABC transporter permease [Caldivirga maquilingensis]ABW01523.1 binding-protein-dependent transport systems inner membrane component [Caldivirga maquilingensis IC-167]
MRVNWLIRRIGLAVTTWFVALFISYVLFEYAPVNPINYILSQLGMLGGGSSGVGGTGPALMSRENYEYIVQWASAFMIHGNPILGFTKYMVNTFKGDWGWSVVYGLPVLTLIARYLPWTLFIVVSANLISFFVGIYLGQYMAYHRGSVGDQAVTQFITVKRSIPVYIYAALLVYFLGFEYHIFPTHGAYSGTPGFNLRFIVSVLYYAALPIFTLAFSSFGHWALSMRGNIISVLGEDYVNYAEARGLPSNWIQRRYVGRNALLPLYTGIIIALGTSFGGAVFVESVFSYPGVGALFSSSLSNGDWALGMGILLILILAVILGMVIADLTYSLIDPRVRQG